MTISNQILEELVDLSRWLGAPEQECAILGEGNTSARVDESSFLVKASGTELRTLDDQGLLLIDFERTLSILTDDSITDATLGDALIAARVEATDKRRPSVETPLHAICLSLEGVNFVGHTHPIAINAFTCSVGFEEALKDRLFPDEVVVCGMNPLLVPYVDPGVVLSRVVKQKLDEHIEQYGKPPATIYLQNHGFIALGSSAKQVKAITAMAVKTARILQGTFAFGGPRAMGGDNVERINSRPDEHYRQSVIEQQS